MKRVGKSNSFVHITEDSMEEQTNRTFQGILLALDSLHVRAAQPAMVLSALERLRTWSLVSSQN